MGVFYFVISFVVLIILSLVAALIGFYGGHKINPLPLKHYRWFLAVIAALLYFWLCLFADSPFMLLALPPGS